MSGAIFGLIWTKGGIERGGRRCGVASCGKLTKDSPKSDKPRLSSADWLVVGVNPDTKGTVKTLLFIKGNKIGEGEGIYQESKQFQWPFGGCNKWERL